MVETIAAYLGILDILVRLTRYGDRRLRRGVPLAVESLGVPDPELSLNDVRMLFHAALERRVGTDRAVLIERAVQVIEEVAAAAQLTGTLDTDRQELIPYGSVLSRVVSVVGACLDRFKVFEAWHQEEYTTWENVFRTDHSVIILPYSWNLLRLSRPQAAPSPNEKSGRAAHLCLKRKIAHPNTEFCLAAYEVGLNNTRFERAGERYKDIRFEGYKMSFNSYLTIPPTKPVKDIDFALFEAMLVGLLLDVVAYDRQVVAELQKSKLLIHNLLGFGRPQVVMPF